jgi:3-hydroxyisobutyrate dehydrogenase-like beta-hydroxyacid dehydrogenase
MGSRMAANLAQAGHHVVAWNRSRVDPPEGATLVDRPAEVGKATSQAFFVVGGPDDVNQFVLGPDGWAEGAAAGSVLVQSTTIGPSPARELAQRPAERDLRMIDAPVVGPPARRRPGSSSFWQVATRPIWSGCPSCSTWSGPRRCTLAESAPGRP